MGRPFGTSHTQGAISGISPGINAMAMSTAAALGQNILGGVTAALPASNQVLKSPYMPNSISYSYHFPLLFCPQIFSVLFFSLCLFLVLSLSSLFIMFSLYKPFITNFAESFGASTRPICCSFVGADCRRIYRGTHEVLASEVKVFVVEI